MGKLAKIIIGILVLAALVYLFFFTDGPNNKPSKAEWAYEDAYNEGYSAGYKEGYEKGEDVGYHSGYYDGQYDLEHSKT